MCSGGCVGLKRPILNDLCCEDCGYDQRKPNPNMGQDLADVVSAGAEHGKEGIADGAFQGASGEAT